MRTTELATDDAHESPRYFNRVSTTLGTEGIAMNFFECDPGEPVGDCYHRHHEQEEIFIVLDGTATFDTEDGDVEVEAGETVRFEPGEWQQGWNRGTDRLRVVALGAPLEEGPTDLRRYCPSCGRRVPVAVTEYDTGVRYTCEVCGGETDPSP